MTDQEKLESLCYSELIKRGLKENIQFEKRLKEELLEVKKQSEAEYFLKLVEQGVKVKENEHNSVIPFLLGICDSVEIDKDAKYTDAEWPDIDVDYIGVVRDYLKDDWVPKHYGEKYVCNISNYTSFGLKSSLLDVARVLSEDRTEILNITTKLGVKDEDGEALTWETAQAQHKDLADYFEAHPRVAEITKGIIHADIDWEKFGYKNPPHRKRGMGMHASGLVISGVPLDDHVPMVVSSGNREKGLQASAWIEGLADTDLSSVGFIKFDFLALEANSKIAQCNKLIMDRHNLTSICAHPGMPNWSDTSYLNDEKALAMANRADLKGIFQFDSDGIRKLTRSSGVNSFDDLAALTSIFRPGPLDSGMGDEFIDRKNGIKAWSVPEIGDQEFIDSLKSTYGVLCFQEQVMRYLSVIGKIPMSQCQGVIKAISKKKEEKLVKYEQDFVKNAQITLNISENEAKEKFKEIKNWAGYGFNLGHATAYTYVSSRMLYQKANYTIEFFAEGLAHLKTADERIREYIDDARRYGIKCNRLDINKSDLNFAIVDKNGKRGMPAAEGDEIYFGFGQIKGIGIEAAERIVKLQPYSGFVDFLSRFGTEAKVVQPLIALRVFKEADPITLFKFYEVYKKNKKKEEDRGRRNIKSVAKYKQSLRELVPELDWITFDEVDFSKARQYVDMAKWNSMTMLKKKYDRCLTTAVIKSYEAEKKIEVLTLDNFNPDDYEIDEETKELLNDPVECEIAYYGFEWQHPLMKCQDYKGLTWADMHMDLKKTSCVLPVEVLIKSRELTKTKTGKDMLKLRCEDAARQTMLVTCWSEEIERFGDVLQVGACVRLRVKVEKAIHGRDSYWHNLESYGWQDRQKMPKDKSMDFRVYVMK